MTLRTVTILAALRAKAFGAVGAATAGADTTSNANVTQVTDLRADYSTDPLGIDDMHPSVSGSCDRDLAAAGRDRRDPGGTRCVKNPVALHAWD